MIELSIPVRLFIWLSLILWFALLVRASKNLPDVHPSIGVFGALWLMAIAAICILGVCIIMGVVR
jgi:hypothetical protein